MTEYYIYDIETYPNVFTCCFKRYPDGARWIFEVSDRKDDRGALNMFLHWLAQHQHPMVGFNNVSFDYPILHMTMQCDGEYAPIDTYDMCLEIIQSSSPWSHRLRPWEVMIPQIDLFLINHFDNVARRTGLKQIEFNHRVPNLLDLPFPPGTWLEQEQIDTLIDYNLNGDVEETYALFKECLPAIEFRQVLTQQYGRDFTNHNDTKIGKDFLIQQLEAAGVSCYDTDRAPVQTYRDQINPAEIILPYVQFQHSEFNRILDWFKRQVIVETKGVFTDVHCTVNGFQFDFGLGGIHGSVEGQTVHSDSEWIVEDWDVASYYPNLAIANRIYPEHLTEKFCDIYQSVYEQRRLHAKGTPENAMLKLALNGVYGDSNNRYSPFYDPQYTMAITINGQLSLCMLAEWLMMGVPNLQMVQINTDGLTVRYRRGWRDMVHFICQEWEQLTRLTLEHVEYSRMFIRDVNNYLAEGIDGSIKRKGAYEYEREHHQNQSMLVVPKVTEMVLTCGMCIETTVRSWPDFYDFMKRVKKPHLTWNGERQQSTCRYYVSESGAPLIEHRQPPAGKRIGDFKKKNGCSDRDYALVNQTGVWDERVHTKNRSVYGESTVEVESGFVVTVANDIHQATVPINYNYYIHEVEKLVRSVQ